MTCCCCFGNLKNGHLRGKRKFTQNPPMLCLPLCFYTVTRICPALGVCKQVCVVACAFYRTESHYSPTDASFLACDVFSSETLYGFLSVHFPGSVWKAGEDLEANRVLLFRVQVLKPPKSKRLRPQGSAASTETGLGSRISVEHSNTKGG